MENVFGKLKRFFNDKWNIAILDLEKGRWIIEAETRFIPYLKGENANGRHILIRPYPEIESKYLMADDIGESLLIRHHKYNDGKWKPGRMVVETSPDNYQVWIHSSRRLSLDEKRHWLKKLKSDPGADPNHRWGRCPGFRNRKDKHQDAGGGYPLARLIWVDWALKARIPSIDMQSSPDSSIPLSPQPLKGGVCQKSFSPQPHSRRISKKSIRRNDYLRQDESATDMAYTLALARRKFTREQIKNRLISERGAWKNHSGGQRMDAYINRTIAKAGAIIGIS